MNSYHLTTWAPRTGPRLTVGLAPRERGPKVDEPAQRLVDLERETTHLAARLGRAGLIIDAPEELLPVLGLLEPALPGTDGNE